MKIIIFFLTFSFSVFTQEYGTGLVLEPFELYSSLPESKSRKLERRVLPSKVDLSSYMPIPGYQGNQGSCVAFSSAYFVRSYQEFIERKDRSKDWNSLNLAGSINPKTVFSPAYVYNSLNKGKDNGITYFEALSFLVNHGVVPWEYMPYEPNNFLKKPEPKLEQIASQFLAKEFRKVRFQDLEEIKSLLADGNPVMVGVLISSNLKELKAGEVYKSHSGTFMGGHAVTLVGYDDSKEAFLFANSWGEAWADKGFGWIDYKWFLKTAKVAYILIDEVEPLILTRGDVVVNFSAGGFENSKKFLPPTEFFATQGNYSDKVVLTWSEVEGALGYEIYRGFVEEEKYEKIGISKNTFFLDTGVQAGVVYSYKIASIFENGISTQTSFQVLGYASVEKKFIPPKLAGVKASKGKFIDKVRIEWESIDFETITGYQVFKWDSRLQKYRPIAKVKSNWYEDNTATRGGVVETYVVAAMNGNITGTFSDAVTGRTAIGQKPEAPKDVVASLGIYTNKIQIKWSRVPTAIEYLVYRYEDKHWIPLGTTSKEEFWDENPGKQKRYYTVVAKNKDGQWGEFSQFVEGYADPKVQRSGIRLMPPQNLQVKLIENNIYLNWESVKGANEYIIWLKKAGERNWIFWGKVEGEDRTSFLTSLYEKNILYLFSVTAVDKDGLESEYSKIESVVYSEAKKATKRAFTKSSKLERIKGTWTGLFWDGTTEAKNLVMKIEPLDESTVKVNLDNKKVYEGKYVQESTEIELEGKVKIKIPSLTTLAVELNDRAIIKDRVEISFLRE